MAEQALIIWAFPTSGAAGRALDVLRERVGSGPESIRGAAIIAWPPDRREPETREFYGLASSRTRRRTWPELFDAIFDGERAVGPEFAQLGVADDLVAELRRHLRPSASILLVVAGGPLDSGFWDAIPELERSRVFTTPAGMLQRPRAYAARR